MLVRITRDCRVGFAILVVAALLGIAGCQSMEVRSPSAQQTPPPAMEPPREKALVSLPAYRIAPPDILQIEMLKQVPIPPYRAQAYDVLQINVVGTLLDQPINDYYLVEAEGSVNLGPAYGPAVRVVGMTIDEIQTTITQHLRRILARPEVSVQLARASGTQPVTGEYLVTPDGTVNLRQYGSVVVAGKTVTEARADLEKHFAQYFDSPEVTVNVVAFNSKVYYVITEGAHLGDNVVRVPITGKETVLDAVSTIGGLSQVSSKRVWIARPAPGGFGCEQIMPVDWEAISRGGVAATNYQIMPGDRVFIAEDQLVALTNFVGIVTAPIERVAGAISLGTSTVLNTETLGRSYNARFVR